MKTLSYYINLVLYSYSDFMRRWRLRRLIFLTGKPVGKASTSNVVGFCRQLEATSLMVRGLKPSDQTSITVTRGELDAFVRYMTDLHAIKASRVVLIMIGLATLMAKDESFIPYEAKQFLKDEFEKSKQGKKSNIVTRW